LLTGIELLERELSQSEAVQALRVLLGTPDGSELAPSWVSGLADAQSWTLGSKFGLAPGTHINLGECKPMKVLMRKLALDPGAHHKRHLIIVDSGVNVGAWAKGRSKSPRLNRELKVCVPDRLCSGLQVGVLHVRSKFNPLDAPSRNRKLRVGPAAHPSADSLLGRLLSSEPLSHKEEDALFLDAAPFPEAVESFF